MSARAWQARREGKRFRIALKRAIKSFDAEPDLVVYLDEWNLCVMSPKLYDWLTNFNEIAKDYV